MSQRKASIVQLPFNAPFTNASRAGSLSRRISVLSQGGIRTFPEPNRVARDSITDIDDETDIPTSIADTAVVPERRVSIKKPKLNSRTSQAHRSISTSATACPSLKNTFNTDEESKQETSLYSSQPANLASTTSISSLRVDASLLESPHRSKRASISSGQSRSNRSSVAQKPLQQLSEAKDADSEDSLFPSRKSSISTRRLTLTINRRTSLLPSGQSLVRRKTLTKASVLELEEPTDTSQQKPFAFMETQAMRSSLGAMQGARRTSVLSKYNSTVAPERSSLEYLGPAPTRSSVATQDPVEGSTGEGYESRQSTAVLASPGGTRQRPRVFGAEAQLGFNFSDMSAIEEMEAQRSLEQAKWRTDLRKGQVKTMTVTDELPNEPVPSVHRKGSRRKVSVMESEFLDFSNVETLQSKLEAVKATAESAKQQAGLWKTKWEEALMNTYEPRRRASVTRHLLIDENKGYKHRIATPESLLKGEKVRDWKLNGQVIEERIKRASVQSDPREAVVANSSRGTLITRAPRTRAETHHPRLTFRPLSSDAKRQRSNTEQPTTNINLIAQFAQKDSNKRAERHFLDLDRVKVGRCPFFSDVDVRGDRNKSVWAVLKNFRFPSEDDKKKLSTVHKLHPSSVSTNNDLRKLLHWAPATFSVQDQKGAQRNRIPAPLLTSATINYTAVPPRIDASNLRQQYERVQADNVATQPFPMLRREIAVGVEPALKPKLVNRILQTAVTTREANARVREDACICAEVAQLVDDNALPFAKAGRDEYRLLKQIQEKHKEMVRARKVGGVRAEEGDVAKEAETPAIVGKENKVKVKKKTPATRPIEMAHWFNQQGYLEYHSQLLGFSISKPVLMDKKNEESGTGFCLDKYRSKEGFEDMEGTLEGQEMFIDERAHANHNEWHA